MELKCSTRYGTRSNMASNVERRDRKCRVCQNKNKGGIKDSEEVIQVIVNSGPTGTMFLCKPHALALAKQIKKAAESID